MQVSASGSVSIPCFSAGLTEIKPSKIERLDRTNMWFHSPNPAEPAFALWTAAGATDISGAREPFSRRMADCERNG